MANEKEVTVKSVTMPLYRTMNLIGCNPNTRTPIKTTLSYSFLITSGIILILSTMNGILSEKPTSAGKFTQETLMIFAYIQIFSKCIICCANRTSMYNLLMVIWNDFPNYKDLGLDTKSKEMIAKLYKWISLYLVFYVNTVLANTTLFIILSGVNRSLIVNIWIPRKELLKVTPYYEIMFVFEAILTESAVYFYSVFVDALYFIMLGLVCVQFKMLKLNILQIGSKKTKNNLELIIKCVKHHNILLNFLKKIEYLYSKLLLPSISSDLFLITFSLYASIMENTTSQKLIFIALTYALTIQLFGYCLIGNLVQDEALSVAQAVFNSNWIDVIDQKLRLSLIFIIQRSHHPINLTMGGFMIMNLQSFTSIVRAAFSFMTVIINIRS